ncbi:MAG: hypothetical protein AAB635_01005, partial [Patescibacteria group bacterium]
MENRFNKKQGFARPSFKGNSTSKVGDSFKGRSFGDGARSQGTHGVRSHGLSHGKSFGNRDGANANRSGANRGARGRFPDNRGNRGGGKSERIDFSRFVNKAVITEEMAHYKPEHKFEDFAVETILKTAIKSKGYTEPTPIQDRAV